MRAGENAVDVDISDVRLHRQLDKVSLAHFQFQHTVITVPIHHPAVCIAVGGVAVYHKELAGVGPEPDAGNAVAFDVGSDVAFMEPSESGNTWQ